MRPVSLELEGFTSFRQNAALDFGALDLFVITGPTGAGKTSLIDAIIYALFGKTPRIGDKDISELISQGTERLRVLLEFRAGKSSYRLLRTLKRGSSQKLRLEVQDQTGEWEPLSDRVSEVRAKVEEILGIDFDGFTKSIVLPQGEFDRFLRGNPIERRRILSDLLHLAIFEEMGKRARQIEQSSRLEQSVIEQHIATTYAGVTAERKADLEIQLKELKSRRKHLSEELVVVHKAQPLAIELSNLRTKYAEMKTNIAMTTESLAKATASSVSAKETAERHKKRLTRLEQLIATCAYNNERHLELNSLLPHARERGQCRLAISDAQTERKKTSAEIEKARSATEKTKQKWEQLAKELKLKDQAVQKAKREMDSAKEQHGSTDGILQVVEALQSAEEQVEERAELAQSIAKTEEQILEIQEEIAQLKSQHQAAEKAYRDAKARLNELQQLHAAADIRRRLKKGEPCPVCYQIISALPSREKHTALDQAKDVLEQREKTKDKSKTLLIKKEDLCESLPTQLQTLRRNLKTIETTISRATAKAERVLGKPPGKNAISELEKLAEQISALEIDYESIATSLRTLQKSEAESREDYSDQEHKMKLLSQRLEASDRTVGEKTERLAQLEKLLRGQPELEALVEELKQMEKGRKEQQTYEKEKKEEQSLHQSAEKQYAIAEADAAGCQQRIAKLQSSMHNAATSAQELEQKIRTHVPIPKGADEIKYLDQFRSSLEQESREIAGHIVRVEKDLDFVSHSLADLCDKRQQLSELKTRAELYRELGISLKADQFISFIVEEALTSLADHGTRHLSRLSSGRYSFATQSDDFLVVDHWNADESRSVNTLSGGESFLASLSLALALGDALSELSPEAGRFSLDSLFLDEGFSTLDAETLDVVVQAIETLAGSERLIGIVSHIPELAERFPAQIEVNKAVGGSTITVKGQISPIQKSAVG